MPAPTYTLFGAPEDRHRHAILLLARGWHPPFLSALSAPCQRENEASGTAGPAGTDFNAKKHSNRAGAFVDVVLRLRSTSLVKMVAAGVRHERRKVSCCIFAGPEESEALK